MHSEPRHLGLLLEQPLDHVGGNVSLDHVTIDLCGVARAELLGNAEARPELTKDLKVRLVLLHDLESVRL
jgi:hypothetical protein